MTHQRVSVIAALVCALLAPPLAHGEVTKVTIASRAVVANGQPFGSVGPYEKLTGTIEFALDPANPRNKPIVDLDAAPRGSDGRVHFTADLYVLQPVDTARGNGTLLFEIANRGRKGILGRFNRAGGSQDPTAPNDFGDGFLMKDGYTIVWVGWQFDVESPGLRVAAPAANVTGRVRFSFIPDEKRTEMAPADLPQYPPVSASDASATLTVRDRNWDKPMVIPRSGWRFAGGNGRPRVILDAGFEPGRLYEIDYPATGARVAGVGLAAIRDAASAFLHGADMPVRGRSAYVFGISQSGRFLRQFLHDGFNADERDRRVFDVVWPHIAGAGQGSFNERFATPGYSSFPATRFPYTDLEQRNAQGDARRHPFGVPAGPDAEGDLHEHVGRVLGSGPRRRADAYDDRRKGRCDGPGERAHLSAVRHAAWRVRISAVVRHRPGDGQSHTAGECHARAAARRASVGRIGCPSS